MKKLYASVFALLCGMSLSAQNMVLTAVYDGPLTGGTPKGVEIYVINNISDLSLYGLGSANNGGGTDGQEFTFPAISANAGDFIYVASDSANFHNFYGFPPNYVSSVSNINGDDAMELFGNGNVIDTYGDISAAPTGWSYMDSWAYRVDNTGPDGATYVAANWTFGTPNALVGETSNSTAATPVPVGTYQRCNLQISDPGSICETGGLVTLSATEPNGMWSTTCGPCLTPAGSFNPSMAGVGSHLITYSVSTGACAGIDTLTINVVAAQDATISPVLDVCVSDSAFMLTAVDLGGAWSGTGVNSMGEFDPVIAGCGSYTISYTIPGSCGSVDTETITVLCQDTVSIYGGDSTLCENDNPTQLYSYTTGGTWTSDCSACLDASGLFNPTTAGMGSYLIEYTTSSTCPGIATQNITVNQQDSVSFNIDVADTSMICLGLGLITQMTNVLPSGGYFTATNGLVIDSLTGEVDNAASWNNNAGSDFNASITYTSIGLCSSSVTNTYNFKYCYSIHESNIDNLISIYPTPVVNQLKLDLGELKLINGIILDLAGKQVIHFTNKTVNVEELPAGMYLVKVNTNKGSAVKQIIKE